jgi:hypothetical protein
MPMSVPKIIRKGFEINRGVAGLEGMFLKEE